MIYKTFAYLDDSIPVDHPCTTWTAAPSARPLEATSSPPGLLRTRAGVEVHVPRVGGLLF